jgi:hypothetical protein
VVYFVSGFWVGVAVGVAASVVLWLWGSRLDRRVSLASEMAAPIPAIVTDPHGLRPFEPHVLQWLSSPRSFAARLQERLRLHVTKPIVPGQRGARGGI